MQSHEIDYELIGDDMQMVLIELDPGETVIAEAGSMNYMEDGIRFEARMGDGSAASEGVMSKLLSVGKRALTGESLFLTHFTHDGHGKARVAFAAPYPGKIIPLNLAEHGREVMCQKDSFLAAAKGTKIGIAFAKRFGAGLFGGEGFILQRLQGDGMAFLHAGGTVIEQKATPNRLRTASGAPGPDYWQQQVDYTIAVRPRHGDAHGPRHGAHHLPQQFARGARLRLGAPRAEHPAQGQHRHAHRWRRGGRRRQRSRATASCWHVGVGDKHACTRSTTR
jgi:uncharacterized protein (AIM24 family)